MGGKATPLGDKYEISPNILAHCKICHARIQQGQHRVGVEAYSSKFGGYTHRYYHHDCFPTDIEVRLPGGRSINEELTRQEQEKLQRDNLIRDRKELRESLRLLRLAFARRLNLPAFCIFEDKVLDNIVVDLPTTKDQLLQVKGIAQKRYQNFGEPILTIVLMYLKQKASREGSEDRLQCALCIQTLEMNKATLDDRLLAAEDDNIEITESLDVEAIVARKFAHAETNGYIIAID